MGAEEKRYKRSEEGNGENRGALVREGTEINTERSESLKNSYY